MKERTLAIALWALSLVILALDKSVQQVAAAWLQFFLAGTGILGISLIILRARVEALLTLACVNLLLGLSLRASTYSGPVGLALLLSVATVLSVAVYLLKKGGPKPCGDRSDESPVNE